MHCQCIASVIRNIVAAIFRSNIIVKRQLIADLIPVCYHFQRYRLAVRTLKFCSIGWICDAKRHVFDLETDILSGLDGARAA